MALIAVSGQPGCRFEEVARLAARRLNFEPVTQSRMVSLIQEELGDSTVPDEAYLDIMASIVARLATEHHLLLSASGAAWLHSHFRQMFRVHVVARDAVRVGSLMLDGRLERPAARQLLRELDTREKSDRRRRFAKASMPAQVFDIILNAESLTSDQMAELIEAAAGSLGLQEQGFLSGAVEAQLQFQMRLRLSEHGIVPPGKARLQPKMFAHQSEQIFATLLDFYRIAWEYEPRSFPIQFDDKGRVLESFTPDFYLPEFNLYVELTTMKQSLVTKKNRKVRRLRELYPDVNIRVYYQKDIENLIFKYGLAERPVKV